MITKEKAVILFALTSLAEKLNIKNNELSPTENLTKKFNKVLEENQNIFNNNDKLKKDIIKLFQKYVKKLNDNNDSKNNKKGG